MSLAPHAGVYGGTVTPSDAIPTYGAAGSISRGDAQDLTPGYPAGITSGQLLILQVESTNIADSPSTPGGWTLQWDDQRNSGSGNEVRQWIYSTYATGSETGTLTVDFPSTGNKIAVIIRITDAHPSTPFEGATLVQGTNDPITGPTLTPSGTNRLGLVFIAVGDNQVVQTVLSGATGGTWTARIAQGEPSGLDSAIFLNTVELNAGAQISGGSFSPEMVTAADWVLRGVLVRPP